MQKTSKNVFFTKSLKEEMVILGFVLLLNNICCEDITEENIANEKRWIALKHKKNQAKTARLITHDIYNPITETLTGTEFASTVLTDASKAEMNCMSQTALF